MQSIDLIETSAYAEIKCNNTVEPLIVATLGDPA